MKWMQHAASALASTILISLWACMSSGEVVAYVSQSGQPNTTLLLPALKNSSVEKIVLLGDYGFGNEFDAYIGHPVTITRNVTITGAPGQLPVLDLGSAPGVLAICSTCTFRIANLALANESAQGTTSGSSAVVSVLQGRAGSKVEVEGVFGLRAACLPTAASLAILNNTQRSPLFPRPGGQQLVNSTEVTYEGKKYTNMLGVVDISSDVALQLVSGGAYVGGYAIRRRNSVRICDNIISAECLKNNSPEACVLQFAGQPVTRAAAPGASAGPAGIAAVVAPVVIAGVLLILAAAGVLLFIRRRRQRQQAAAQQRLLPDSSKAPSAAAAAVAGDAVVLPGDHDDDHHASGPHHLTTLTAPLISQQQQQTITPQSQQQGGSGSPPPGPAGVAPPSSSTRPVSWQLAWSQTAPSMQWVDDNDMDIQLGPLLGAGSFARVFKASWAGLDVAVKVIQHDSSTSATVAHEVQLMMRLNHPNIVRAYHCITRQLQQPAPVDFSSSRASSSSVSRLVPDTPAAVTSGRAVTLQDSGRSRQQSPTQIPVIEPVVKKSSVHSSSIQKQQQQQQQLRNFGGISVQKLDAFEPAMPEDPEHLTIVVPVPRLPPDLPATPSVVTSGYNMPSSVISSLPTDPGTSSMGILGQSASTSGIKTLYGSIAHTASGSTEGVITVPDPEEATYVRKGAESPANTSAVPQTLGQPVQQAGLPLAPAAAAAAVISSSISAAEDSPEQQSHHEPPPRRLSTIYSASCTPSAGTVSNSDTYAMMGGQAAAAAVAADDRFEQQHIGTLDSPVLEAASSRGAGPAALTGRPGAHRQQDSSQPIAAVGSSTYWPVIIEEQQQHRQQQQSGSRGNSRSSAAGATSPSPDSSSAALADVNAVVCETWLVTELCDQGTLARVAADWRPSESAGDMLRLLVLLLDVSRGLKLLHAKNIVHADLNAHNILVSSGSTAQFGLVAKIADLGLSRVIKQHATHRTTRTVGTLSHQPPELLRDGHSSTAVDVYSFGVMMWELYMGQAAFARMRYGQIYHQVVICDARPAVPPDMPDDYHLLMASCWSSGPDERPTVDMLMHCIELMIQDRQQGGD